MEGTCWAIKQPCSHRSGIKGINFELYNLFSMMNKVFIFLNLSEFFYKKRLIKNLKKHLQNLNIFIDIGAHYGETTIEFSKYFNIKNAFLFEPNKINFEKLKKNLNNHEKIDKIEIFNLH